MKTRVDNQLQAIVVSKGDSKTRLNAASILHSDMKSFEMAAIKVLLQLSLLEAPQNVGIIVERPLIHVHRRRSRGGPVPSAIGLHVTRHDGHGSLASLHAHANAQQLAGIRS